MSLFRARTWWSTRVGTGEEFDGSAIRHGVLSDGGPMSIVVGSLNGFLRVFAPSEGDFSVEDLLVETDLGDPVLGVELGKFLPASDEVGIAVLHPRKLAGE
jgi:hypothetical protein